MAVRNRVLVDFEGGVFSPQEEHHFEEGLEVFRSTGEGLE